MWKFYSRRKLGIIVVLRVKIDILSSEISLLRIKVDN